MRTTLIKITAFGSLVFLLGLQSCKKETDPKYTEQTSFNNSSVVQLYMAMQNASRNYLHVDNKPVNGASIVTGAVFPAVTPGFAVEGGFRAFLLRDTLTAATQLPLSFAENMQVNKRYTIFVYDTISAPKQKTVETNIVVPSDNSARLRFANFVYSPTAIPAVDIFSKKQNATIFTNVQISEATNFISIPSGITDTFYIRSTGTGTNLQNYRQCNPTSFVDIIAILTPQAKRSYTLVFRGGYRASNVFTSCPSSGTPPSNPSIRQLSVFANY